MTTTTTMMMIMIVIMIIIMMKLCLFFVEYRIQSQGCTLPKPGSQPVYIRQKWLSNTLHGLLALSYDWQQYLFLALFSWLELD